MARSAARLAAAAVTFSGRRPTCAAGPRRTTGWWRSSGPDSSRRTPAGRASRAGVGGRGAARRLDDGIRKRIDEESYKIRFTLRRAGSTGARSTSAGLLCRRRRPDAPRGLVGVLEKRENRSGIDPTSGDPASFPCPRERARCRPRPAGFLAAQPPSYRELVTWWVVSAKKEETRMSRLDKLVAAGTPANSS